MVTKRFINTCRARVASRLAASREKGRVALQVFRGFGSHRAICLFGSVFKQPFYSAKQQRGNIFINLILLIKRLLRRGVAYAVVDARIGASRKQATCDRTGFFFIRMRPDPGADQSARWQAASVTVCRPASRAAVTRTAPVYIAPAGARYVVISDIDDTVVYTGVANKLRMLWHLFFSTASQRYAFPGVAELYRELHRGASTRPGPNPMLYLSRAPWAIYDVLDAFFNLHGIPVGPVLFLRYWGLTLDHPLPRRARDHKLDAIRKMLSIYDQMPFILIGDSGQKDPEIYSRIVRENPQRILAVYIRSISSSDAARRRSIRKLAGEVARAGCDLILAADSLAMARHARQCGFIDQRGVERIAAACRG